LTPDLHPWLGRAARRRRAGFVPKRCTAGSGSARHGPTPPWAARGRRAAAAEEAAVSFKPDPRFYPSPRMAAAGPREELAYVVTLNTGTNGDRRPDALCAIDVQDGSPDFGSVVGRLEMPNVGDELH